MIDLSTRISTPVKEGARSHGKSYEDGGEVDDLPEASVSKLVSQDGMADHHVSGCKSVNDILLYMGGPNTNTLTIEGQKMEIKFIPEDPNRHGHKPGRLRYLRCV